MAHLLTQKGLCSKIPEIVGNTNPSQFILVWYLQSYFHNCNSSGFGKHSSDLQPRKKSLIFH